MKSTIIIIAFLLAYQSLFGQEMIKDTLAFDCISQSDTIDGQSVFQEVDKMPQYSGGTEQLYKFISKNVKFPERQWQNAYYIKIFITFIIDTTGQIRNECILKFSIEGTASKENITSMKENLLAVVKRLDKFIPGIHKGQKVAVKYSLPISFHLR